MSHQEPDRINAAGHGGAVQRLAALGILLGQFCS
jgi:hypothetical protein